MARPAASTVVVVTWRGRAHITACLDAVAAQRRPHRLLVVDNASDDGTAAQLAAHPARPEVLRLPHNAGYAGALHAALARVQTPYVAWLNDDAEPAPEWLGLLEDALDGDPHAGAVSPRLVRPDGSVQSLGVRLTSIGYGADVGYGDGDGAGDVCSERPVAYNQRRERAVRNTTMADGRAIFGFCGGAALLRTEALRTVGGVPAEFFCYYEDTDTSWRLRLAGWDVVSVPDARVTHAHGASSSLGSADFHRWNERNRLLMLLRCAPAAVAARELARFAVITAALPARRARGQAGLDGPSGTRSALDATSSPPTPNFRVRLRLRVLAEVAAGVPRALRVRCHVRTGAAVRRTVWRSWAGRER